MRWTLIFTLTSALVFSAMFTPPSETVGGLETVVGKGDTVLENKSPCLEEDVYACQASGGTFNWSHCTCL
jgi:hypothetical protein